MAVEIIPAINASTFTEVGRKVRLVEPYVSWAHIDVADGSFTDIALWHEPHDLLNFRTPLSLEVHLMIAHIDERIIEWLLPNVRRVVFHIEAARNAMGVIDACHRADVLAGIGVRPGTSYKGLLPYAQKADMLHVLAVPPGPGGQMFQESALGAVRGLRESCGVCPIEVDGGVNGETAERIVNAGANILVAGSAIFSHDDIGSAVAALKDHVAK